MGAAWLEVAGLSILGHRTRRSLAGLIGLRLVGEHPDAFERVVASNTGLPTGPSRLFPCLLSTCPTSLRACAGEFDLGDAFRAWRHFSQTSPDFDVGRIVQVGAGAVSSRHV